MVHLFGLVFPGQIKDLWYNRVRNMTVPIFPHKLGGTDWILAVFRMQTKLTAQYDTFMVYCKTAGSICN